ncbi:MAG: hypothetical protein AAF196_01900 [Planctomycetota bacterium]
MTRRPHPLLVAAYFVAVYGLGAWIGPMAVPAVIAVTLVPALAALDHLLGDDRRGGPDLSHPARSSDSRL